MEQLRNEATYRQLLVQGALAVLLPTEELRNPCVRTLVADVIADMILGTGVGGKASEGWLIFDGIAKAIDSWKAKVETRMSGAELETDTRSRLEKYGLVSSKEKHQSRGTGGSRGPISVSAAFWRIVQCCYMTFMTIRFVLLGLLAAASTAPPRDLPAVKRVTKSDYATPPIAAGVEAPSAAGKRPILTYSIFEVLSQLLELPSRTPWTHGLISLVQWHLVGGVLQVGATNGILDR